MSRKLRQIETNSVVRNEITGREIGLLGNIIYRLGDSVQVVTFVENNVREMIIKLKTKDYKTYQLASLGTIQLLYKHVRGGTLGSDVTLNS